jgi:hypothetical protein
MAFLLYQIGSFVLGQKSDQSHGGQLFVVAAEWQT